MCVNGRLSEPSRNWAASVAQTSELVRCRSACHPCQLGLGLRYLHLRGLRRSAPDDWLASSGSARPACGRDTLGRNVSSSEPEHDNGLPPDRKRSGETGKEAQEAETQKTERQRRSGTQRLRRAFREAGPRPGRRPNLGAGPPVRTVGDSPRAGRAQGFARSARDIRHAEHRPNLCERGCDVEIEP